MWLLQGCSDDSCTKIEYGNLAFIATNQSIKFVLVIVEEMRVYSKRECETSYFLVYVCYHIYCVLFVNTDEV